MCGGGGGGGGVPVGAGLVSILLSGNMDQPGGKTTPLGSSVLPEGMAVALGGAENRVRLGGR